MDIPPDIKKMSNEEFSAFVETPTGQVLMKLIEADAITCSQCSYTIGYTVVESDNSQRTYLLRNTAFDAFMAGNMCNDCFRGEEERYHLEQEPDEM